MQKIESEEEDEDDLFGEKKKKIESDDEQEESEEEEEQPKKVIVTMIDKFSDVGSKQSLWHSQECSYSSKGNLNLLSEH